MTDLKLDRHTALALAKTGPRMKPIGVSRAYKVPVSFSIDGIDYQADDYIVVSAAGAVTGETQAFVDSHFAVVAKRNSKKDAKE